jgi:hypothetical protein
LHDPDSVTGAVPKRLIKHAAGVIAFAPVGVMMRA